MNAHLLAIWLQKIWTPIYQVYGPALPKGTPEYQGEHANPL